MAITKKIKMLFKITNVEVYIFTSTDEIYNYDSKTTIPIKKTTEGDGFTYSMHDGGKLVHKTSTYTNVYILKLIKINGLAVGSGYTNPEFRGQSILPKVLSHIANDNIKKGPLYAVINTDNAASIKAVGKAGFKKLAYIKAKKWLFLYFDKKIERY